MAGHYGEKNPVGQLWDKEASAAAERMSLKVPEGRLQNQVESDLDALGIAQQVTAELLDRLTSRLGAVLGPEYPSPSNEQCATVEPSRCLVAARVRVSYSSVVDINSRLNDLLDRLQV